MADLTLEQHVSTHEDSETVGYRWIIDADHSVWVGEISRRCFDDLSDEEQDAYKDDSGCFYVLYGKRFSAVLGRAPDLFTGKDIAEALALGLAARPNRIAELLGGHYILDGTAAISRMAPCSTSPPRSTPTKPPPGST